MTRAPVVGAWLAAAVLPSACALFGAVPVPCAGTPDCPAPSTCDPATRTCTAAPDAGPDGGGALCAREPRKSARACDDFERADGAVVGDAVRGGPWACSPDAVTTLVDGRLRIALPSGTGYGECVLGDVVARDVDASVRVFVDVPSNVSGGQLMVRHVAGQREYNVSAHVGLPSSANTAGSALGAGRGTQLGTLDPPAGDAWRVRLRVTGASPTRVRAKLWDASVAEPPAWAVDVNDATPVLQGAGDIALGAFDGDANADFAWRFDEVVVYDAAAIDDTALLP